MAASSTSSGSTFALDLINPTLAITSLEEGLEEDLYDKRLIDFAQSILGRGYNSDSRLNPNSRLLGEVFDPSAAEIEVRHVGTLEAYHSAFTTNSVVEKLKTKFKLNFNFCTPATVSITPFLKYSTNETSEEERTKIVYITTYVNYLKCEYKDLSALKLKHKCETLNEKNVGDRFISSIWTYTGYKILAEMTVDSDSESTQTEWQVGGSATGWSCTLGNGFDRLKENLKNRKVSDIKLIRQTFGRYGNKQVKTYNLDSMEALDDKMSAIQDKYLSCIIRIRHPKVSIDDSCLTAYTDNRLTWHTTPKSLLPLIDETIVPKQIESEPDFEALSSRIETFLGVEGARKFRKKILLEELNHIQLLRNLETVFLNVFLESQNLQPFSTPSSIVIGYTGSGKSSLIRYLKGEEFIWEEDFHDDGSLITQLIPKQVGKETLKTGAFGSVTVGYESVPGYIDTAGLLDSRGSEFDICNSNAIKMATRLLRPQRIIFVLEPSIFEDTRCKKLFDFITLISRIISNPTGEREFASILFVVNDKKEPNENRVTHEGKRLRGRIIAAKNTLQSELELRFKALPKAIGWWQRVKDVFNRSSELTKKDIEKMNDDLDEPTYNALIETYDQIQILNCMLEQGNFIAANMISTETRIWIRSWEERSPGIAAESFTMGALFQGGEEIFNVMISNLAGYFNSLYVRKFEIENKFIPSIRRRIDEISSEKEKILSTEGTNDELKNYTENIEKLNKLKEDNIKELRKKIKIRKKFQNEPDYITQLPDKEITPRSWWAWTDWSAKTYTISYNDQNGDPIQYVRTMRTAAAHRKWPLNGTYFDAQEGNRIEGKYSVKFLPAHHNYDGDCDARIRVYLKKKHLTKHIPQIQFMKQSENNLSIEIVNLDQDIKRVERIQKLFATVENITRSTTVKTLDNEIQIKNKELKNTENDLKEINEELFVYKEYCILIWKIIHHLGLHEVNHDSDLSVLPTFYSNFRDTDISQSSSSAAASNVIVSSSSSSESSSLSLLPNDVSQSSSSTAASSVPVSSSISSGLLSPPSDEEDSLEAENLEMTLD